MTVSTAGRMTQTRPRTTNWESSCLVVTAALEVPRPPCVVRRPPRRMTSSLSQARSLCRQLSIQKVTAANHSLVFDGEFAPADSLFQKLLKPFLDDFRCSVDCECESSGEPNVLEVVRLLVGLSGRAV